MTHIKPPFHFGHMGTCLKWTLGDVFKMSKKWTKQTRPQVSKLKREMSIKSENSAKKREGQRRKCQQIVEFLEIVMK